jgi:hypothetical protein
MVVGSIIPAAIIVLGGPSNRLEGVGFEYGGGKYPHTQTHTHFFYHAGKSRKSVLKILTTKSTRFSNKFSPIHPRGVVHVKIIGNTVQIGSNL